MKVTTEVLTMKMNLCTEQVPLASSGFVARKGVPI
jgi:hypothetical protein